MRRTLFSIARRYAPKLPAAFRGKSAKLNDTLALLGWVVTLLDKAIRDQDADMVKQVPPFTAQLKISEDATKTLDESVRITSGSTLEKLVPEVDGSATRPKGSKEGRSEAELRRHDDERHQKANGEQQSGDQKEGLRPQQCGPAGGAEEEVGGREGNGSDQRATAVSPDPSVDENNREKHHEGDGHHGETEQAALPNTERTIANEDSRSQATPPAHPGAGSQQRETTPVTSGEQEESPTAPAVRAKIQTDIRLDSALQQQLVGFPAPHGVIQSSAKLPSPTGGGDTGSGRNENDFVVVLEKPSHEARRDASSGDSTREGESISSHPEAPLTTRADGAREPQHVRVQVETTATLGNGGDAISSAAISPTGLPFGACNVGVPCDDEGGNGKADLASIAGRSATPMEEKKTSVGRDSLGARILTEAAEKLASGGSKEKLTAPSPVEQTCKDDHNGADGSTRIQEKSVSSTLRPGDVVDSDEVVKDALFASFHGETSRLTADNSSVTEPSANSPVEAMGKAPKACAYEDENGVTGGIDRALSTSRLALPSTAQCSVTKDRWSVRILAEARTTLACYGVLGRSVSVSLKTFSGLLPSAEKDDRCGHKVTWTERRHSSGGGGGGGRGSASSFRKQRLSLPPMRARSSRSTGRRKRLNSPIARGGSREGVVAASVRRWTACGPASSRLPGIADVRSCSVCGSASKLVASRRRTMCIGDGRRGKLGLVKNNDDTPRPSQESPKRSNREGNSRERVIVLVPTRPPGRAHPLDGMSMCVSRASLAAGKNLVSGGSRRDGKDVPVEFSGHIVVSPAYWKGDAGGGDSGGSGFVAGDRGQGLSLPAPQRRSTKSAVEATPRRPSWPWPIPSPPQLPIVVDTGSLELDDSALAWAVKKTPGLRQRDVNACRRTKGRPQHLHKRGGETVVEGYCSRNEAQNTLAGTLKLKR